MSELDMLPKREIRWYGWKPDLPSAKDHYMAPEPGIEFPPSVDLRPQFANIPPYDQGQEGSCTANAIAAAIQHRRAQDGHRAWHPSRQFIYYGERVIEDSVDYDAGAEIRDGMKVVATIGYCHERLWPYELSNMTKKPPQEAFDDAAAHTIASYQRVGLKDGGRTIPLLKTPFVKGQTIVFGFTVYDSFESREVAASGIVPMPNIAKDTALGGHAVLGVGYDDAKQMFIVRNSWGSDWGDKGYFYMPYAYLTDPNLSDDFWTILLS